MPYYYGHYGQEEEIQAEARRLGTFDSQRSSKRSNWPTSANSAPGLDWGGRRSVGEVRKGYDTVTKRPPTYTANDPVSAGTRKESQKRGPFDVNTSAAARDPYLLKANEDKSMLQVPENSCLGLEAQTTSRLHSICTGKSGDSTLAGIQALKENFGAPPGSCQGRSCLPFKKDSDTPRGECESAAQQTLDHGGLDEPLPGDFAKEGRRFTRSRSDSRGARVS